LEPSQTKIPTEKRTRASGQIAGRKGRVQHRKEELLSIRHDNPPPQRLHNEAEADQARPGLGSTAVDK